MLVSTAAISGPTVARDGRCSCFVSYDSMRITILVSLFLAAAPAGLSLERYKLGERNAKITIGTEFPGETVHLSDLFGGTFVAGEELRLHHGGVLLRRRNESSNTLESLSTFLVGSLGSSSVTVVSAMYYDQLAIVDFFGGSERRLPYEVQIGVYNRASREWEEKYWRETNLGKIIAIVVDTVRRRHHCLVNIDVGGRQTLMMNIWKTSTSANVVDEEVKIVTYNLWHTNPPHWALPDEQSRWERYNARVELFSQVLANENPDIILLQEVRLDNSLRGGSAEDQSDGGNQMNHILRRLRTQQPSVEWQYIFYPASSMFDETTYQGFQQDEGLAILSKHPLDLSSLKVLLLPRLTQESSDDHSRIVLHATAMVADDVKIDVMTSHFSLSSVARERAVEFMQQAGIGTERVQVFGGDLNAEPHEGAIQLLKVQGFQDTWSELHVDEDGFSFPACRPTKRIDYLFFRPSGRGDRGETETIKSISIIGKESLEELKLGVLAGGIELAPEVGMLDAESLLWASDHFGLSLVLRTRRNKKHNSQKDEL